MPDNVPYDREDLAAFCRRHGIVRLAFFGSVLRDDFGPASDVDVLVDFAPGRAPGFIRLHGIVEELSGILDGRRVDLVTSKGLNARLRDGVVASAEVQFAA